MTDMTPAAVQARCSEIAEDQNTGKITDDEAKAAASSLWDEVNAHVQEMLASTPGEDALAALTKLVELAPTEIRVQLQSKIANHKEALMEKLERRRSKMNPERPEEGSDHPSSDARRKHVP